MAVTDATDYQAVLIVSTRGGHHAWIGVGDKRRKIPTVFQIEKGSPSNLPVSVHADSRPRRFLGTR